MNGREENKMDLTFTPYKEIGSLPFYASNDSAIKVFGEPISQSKYGYPEKNKNSYDYGFFHVLLSEDLKFEAIELFPDMTDEKICLLYNNSSFILSPIVSKTLEELNKVTDDLLLDDDGEGYTSKTLGLRIYCPDDIIEQVIIHDADYYKS